MPVVHLTFAISSSPEVRLVVISINMWPISPGLRSAGAPALHESLGGIDGRDAVVFLQGVEKERAARSPVRLGETLLAHDYVRGG